MLRAIVSGKARWEPWPDHYNQGKLVFRGISSVIPLRCGLPVIPPELAEHLRELVEGRLPMKALGRWLLVAFWTLLALAGWGTLLYALAIVGCKP